MKRFVLATMLASGCAPVLHYTALATEVAAVGSLGCDAISTHTALAADPRRIESNDSVMGQHPGIGMETAYFGGVAAVDVAFNESLQLGAEHGRGRSIRRGEIADIWRIAANTVMFAVEMEAIQNNVQFVGHACGI